MLCVFITISLSIHLSTDNYVASTAWLRWMMLQRGWDGGYPLKTLILFVLMLSVPWPFSHRSSCWRTWLLIFRMRVTGRRAVWFLSAKTRIHNRDKKNNNYTAQRLKNKASLLINWQPHSSILAWRIPWTEQPGRLQSTGSKKVGHNWATSLLINHWLHLLSHTLNLHVSLWPPLLDSQHLSFI